MLKKGFVLGMLSMLILAKSWASNTHTIHNVQAHHGAWTGRLVIISAEQAAYFTNEQGDNIGAMADFTLLEGQDYRYGFGFDIANTDFNVAYSLTLYEREKFGFSAKSCVFIITAKGPAFPDIQVNGYHGAQCDYQIVDGVGENFQVG